MKTTMKTIRLFAVVLSTAWAGAAGAGPASDAVDKGEVFTIATFKVKPGHEAAFERIMKQVSDDSRNEPGNLEYRLHQSVDNPRVYTAYEAFRDAEAAKAHGNADHIQRILPAVLKMLDGGVGVQAFKLVK